jgi:hypothetical protein
MDGSRFEPSLKRGVGYRIGPKGSEVVVSTFEEALNALRSMEIPRWRRPNPAGNWGIVSGIRWGSICGQDDEPSDVS